MIDKATRLLILWSAALGLTGTSVFSAEALPPRALARLGSHRFYHGPGIVCAALSPDGRRAASAANDFMLDFGTENERDDYNRTIVLWDTASGERLREMRIPEGMVSGLAFSTDGKQLAASYYDIAGEEPGVALFAVETGRLLRRLSDFQAPIGCLQYSADGKQLWVSEEGGPVSAWDTATGKQLRHWEPPAPLLICGDALIVSAREGMLSPDGSAIVWEMWCCSTAGCLSAWMDCLRVHDAQTNKLIYQKKFIDPNQEESEHSELKGPFVFSADGKRLMADGDDKLLVWEAATGRELATLKVPGMLRFSQTPDGRRAVIEEAEKGREHSRLCLWDIETDKPLRELLPIFGNVQHTLGKTSLAFSSNGKTLLAASDSTLRLFDAATGKEHTVPGHRAPVTPRYSDDGRTLITSCAERRCRWKISGKEPTSLRRESRKAWEADCLAQSADGKLSLEYFSEPFGERVCIRETATGCLLHTLRTQPHFAAFSPDATRLLLSISHGEGCYNLPLYDVQTGKKLSEIQMVEKRGEPVFSSNGRLLAWADRTGVVHLHDAATGKNVRTLRPSWPLPKTDEIYPSFSLLFSPDGEKLIAAGDLTSHCESGSGGTIRLPLRVFDVSSGREIAEFYAKTEKWSRAAELSCMACSPDGRLLAVAEKGSGGIRVFEIASGQVRAEFAGHRHGVRGLVFAPDGQTLASGGEDNVVFLWDVRGTKTISTIETALASSWHDLASGSGPCAGIAIAALLRQPEASVTFLRAQLHPEEATSEKHLAQWICDLDADAYLTREAASRELTRLDERAGAALRRALTSHPTLEVRRRIEDILNKLEPHSPPPETLRKLRAIEVLEHVNTPAARRCLEVLAKGAADARQTRDAKAALQRLAKRQ